MATEYSSERELKEIINECDEMSKDIIRRLCERAIRTFNRMEKKWMVNIFADDYPSNFTFFDKLSIELQTKTYDEISPFLEDYIYDTLENEYEHLSREERFFVDHSDYFEIDSNEIQKKIYKEFCNLYNEHISIKKIENYLERV